MEPEEQRHRYQFLAYQVSPFKLRGISFEFQMTSTIPYEVVQP